MFNPRAFENSRPDGIGVLEVVNESGPEAGERLFVPLKHTELHGEVVGPLAALRLVQVFGYTRKQCGQVLEAVYRFPLPGDAAVTRVRVRFGDVEILAELKERKAAEDEYERAKAHGQQAALATRESPDVFTLQVAGLQPDQDVTVETFYVQLARTEGDGWSLRIPLTTAPRYVRSDELTSRHAKGQPLALLRDPGHRFQLDVTVQGTQRVSSSTHRLELATEKGAVRVRLQDGEIIADRDCVLRWQPMQSPDRPALQVWLHDDVPSEQVYLLALVAPPGGLAPAQSVPREVLLLVDHSGSMQGAKWAAADWAVKRFLSSLTERDAFGLGLFHNKTRWFSERVQTADGQAIEAALHFLETSRDSGGTELGVALEQALNLEKPAGDISRHLLIITDAQVSDEGRVLRLADEESQRTDRRRIHVLCIDAAPNSYLALSLAERGGGIARFLTSSPEEEDITTALDEVLLDWAAPAVAGLRLELNRASMYASGHAQTTATEAGWCAADLGDLPAGRAVWLIARTARGNAEELKLGLVAGKSPSDLASARVDISPENADRPTLKALFGARQVLGLEFLISSGYERAGLAEGLKRLGYDADAVLGGVVPGRAKLYAENVRAEADKALRKLLVDEALHYGLACSETAFVAVRTEAGKPVEAQVVVANALPAGWSETFLARPAFGGPMLASMVLPGAGAPRVLASRPQRPRMAVASAGLGAAMASARASKATKVFTGKPSFAGGEALLFDTSRAEDAKRLSGETVISRLEIAFPDGAPDAALLDAGLAVWVFVDDPVSPRARVRLVDLLRQGLRRPLNLARKPGQLVRVLLVDPNGAWARTAPRVTVSLAW